MNRGLQWRAGVVFALVLLFVYLTVANFIPKAERVKSDLWPDEGLRLGLDLQGGIHWVVGVKMGDAITHELEVLRDSVRDDLKDKGVTLARASVEGTKLELQPTAVDDLSRVEDAAKDTRVLQLEGEPQGDVLTYTLTARWLKDVRERTMLQVLEVLRRRINDPVKGIPDSVVTRQGEDRVLVQIPGGHIDRDQARKLLKSTGFLEFKIVKDRADSEELLLARLKDGVPDGDEIQLEKDPRTNKVVAAYLVSKSPDLTGDFLADARVGYDRQQRSLVNFTFNSEGAKRFAQLTGDNIGKLLAIVLDGNVYSAPVIRSRIGARGQITGRFSPQEAADLAVVLRAGALSVPVVIEEERTVGPELGHDSIDSGIRASILGLVLVLFFTGIYYRLSGVYACIALVSNLFLLVGVMSLFGATLTMPGIAGLVLTVGMAVDANVIIFERIREELRAGKTPRASISTGFNKATWTVLDANITTLITALILFQFGTGPIKGFAVTLSIGILTSVFSALVITRILYQLYPGGRTVQTLSI